MRIGIDLGGTKIEAIALDEHDRVLFRERIPTPAGDYASILQAIAALVRKVESTTGQTGTVGIATPGALSQATGLLKNSNSVCLNGKPLADDLVAALSRPIRLANDANCFALSEAHDGAGREASIVFGVILGTGVGGGIVVRGQLLSGANAIAGEWGHNPLPWPAADEMKGPPCYCGRQGCIETYLSGPGMARDHVAYGGEPLSASEIVALADDGHDQAIATVSRYENRLARALAYVINILDPDVVVLGGGLSNISRLYGNVPKLWGRFIFSNDIQTRLVKNLHGDSSGVRGAAWLWDQQ